VNAVILYLLIHILNQCTGSHFWCLEGYIFVTGVCTEQNKIRIWSLMQCFSQ